MWLCKSYMSRVVLRPSQGHPRRSWAAAEEKLSPVVDYKNSVVVVWNRRPMMRRAAAHHPLII